MEGVKMSIWSELLGKYISLCFKVSLILGFIYLFYFCLIEGVPFPSSISDLPLLLTCIAAVSCVVLTAMVSFVVLPRWFNTVTLSSPYRDSLAKGRFTSTSLWLVAVPSVLFFYTLFFQGWFLSNLGSLALISISLCSFLSRSLYLARSSGISFRLRAKYWAALALSAAFNVAIVFWWMLVIAYIALSLMKKEEVLGAISDGWMLVMVLLTPILLSLIAGLASKRAMLNQGGVHGYLGAVCFAFVLTVANPYLGASLGALALRALYLGGGVDVEYVMSPETPASLRKALGIKENGILVASLMLDLGDEVVVSQKILDKKRTFVVQKRWIEGQVVFDKQGQLTGAKAHNQPKELQQGANGS